MSSKEAVHPAGAIPPLGPYSHAISTGDFLFCSGQLPIDPAQPGGAPPAGIEAQTRRVLENLRLVLEARGLDFSDVVKTTVFMTNLAEFQGMNAVYAEYFPAPFPARSTVQVAALPRGAAVEIEAVARGRSAGVA